MMHAGKRWVEDSVAQFLQSWQLFYHKDMRETPEAVSKRSGLWNAKGIVENFLMLAVHCKSFYVIQERQWSEIEPKDCVSQFN